jgi:hypothetical protein
MNCQNCNSQITCGCQIRFASDGQKVCTNCINFYEKSLSELKNANDINNIQDTQNDLPTE